ncbi:unnamed protein product [Pocillopora meandrina]|uniref:Uncharacterized protein n=1 Tax=Pocillopora meandrina TaxID=46732 RepID=A0AAU9WF59_9CNID|nr:unnamed protein product [Pocillopora meandrina]
MGGETLEFCEKEKQVLSERIAELEEQLTEEQRHELEVKLETSEKHIPLICVGDNSEDDDIIFILPEDYSPRKRLKIDHEKKAHRIGDQDNQAKKDLAITYYKPGTNLPHARENCSAHKFVQSNVTTATVSCNENYCEQCYCYVCDANVKECNSWKNGTNPHCNAYSKNAFWEKLRKMAKRKVSSVQDSLLKCLPANEQSKLLLEAAEMVTELLENLKDKLSDSSSGYSSRSSSPSCDCDCHYDSCGSYDSQGCEGCYDYHEERSCSFGGYWSFGGMHLSRFDFNLIDNVESTVKKARDFLDDNQPGPAAIVLDALTVVLLPADSERLRKAWIQVFMHPDLPKNIEEKVRERLKNAVDGAQICSPESIGLNVILEMRKWDDTLLLKCFDGKLKNDFIREDEEVVEARLSFLEKNQRFSDALSYMLSCKTLEKNHSASYYGFGGAVPSTTEKCVANITHYKKKFVLLLAKAGKVEQALNVLNFPVSGDIPASILSNTGFKDTRGTTPLTQCTLAIIDFATTKKLLIAMVNENSSVEAGKIPSPSSIPEEKLKKVLAFIMTATQVNSNLRNEQAFEWFINTFCESSIINKCSPEENQEVIKAAGEIVNKAKQEFLSHLEVKPPEGVSLKVFVVELFASVVANLYVNNNCYPYFPISYTLELFKKKDLLWACVSVVLSPVLTNKINGQILNFMQANVIKTLGSQCIPYDVYKSWIKKQVDIGGIERNYEIALLMLKEGRLLKKCQEGSSIRKKAVSLVKTLIKTVDALLSKNGSSNGKDRLCVVLKKIKNDFAKEIVKCGLDSLEGKLMGLIFKNDPSFENFEDVRKACGDEKWPSIKSEMMDFLKKHLSSRSHAACCVEVFGRYGMYDEVKQTLAAVGSSNVSTICEKIKVTLLKLEKPDEACQFADACCDWLSKTLCDVAFCSWRYNFNNLPDSVVSCVKAIAAFKQQTSNDILTAAMRHTSEYFSRNTVQHKHRCYLERWLREIKGLFGKCELTAWSWAFHELTTGPLKRKSAVIKHLMNSTSLQSGTLTYSQLRLMQTKAKVNTASKDKNTPAHAQGKVQKRSGCETQAPATSTVQKNVSGGSFVPLTSGKQAQGSAQERAMNAPGCGTQGLLAATASSQFVNSAQGNALSAKKGTVGVPAVAIANENVASLPGSKASMFVAIAPMSSASP